MVRQSRYAWEHRALLLVLGVAVFLLYLYFFVPFSELIEAVQRANPFYFLLALCALLMSLVFNSLTWQRLLGVLSVKAPFHKTLQFILVEGFVDLVLPGEPVSGDASRIYLMSKESGENYGKVFASVVGHRILTTSVAVGGLIISVAYFALSYRAPSFVLEFAVAVAFGDAILIALLFYLGTRTNATKRIVSWLIDLLSRISRGRWQFGHLKGRTERMLDVFHEEVITLGKNPKSLVLCLFSSVFGWFLDVVIAVLIFLSLGALGTTISFSAVVIAYSIGGAIQYIPIGVIPGEAGLTEIVMTSLFTLLGSPQAIAVFAVATVLIRVLTFWVRLFIGGVVVQLLGIKSLKPPVGSRVK